MELAWNTQKSNEDVKGKEKEQEREGEIKIMTLIPSVQNNYDLPER